MLLTMPTLPLTIQALLVKFPLSFSDEADFLLSVLDDEIRDTLRKIHEQTQRLSFNISANLAFGPGNYYNRLPIIQ